MFVVCVTSLVKPEHREAYIEACKDNARNTRKEPGNLRFDLLQSNDDPNQFFFYEVYHEEADFKRHHETAHYLEWRKKADPWMQKPRVGLKHSSLMPDDDDKRWKS